MRTESLVLLCSLLLLFKISSASEVEDSKGESEKRPNIILMVADDHGLDALGCYGNKVIQTPNLDELASKGVRFTNAYCTSASCAASRSVILTGQFGHATGSYGHTHDYHHFSTFDGVKSLPVLLSEDGYYTARIGKYHLAPERVYHFDETIKANSRNTVEMSNACKEIFNGDKPFFLYFCTSDPHRGAFSEPKKWNTPNSFGNRVDGYEGVEPIKYSPEEVIVPDFLPDTKESREELAQYYQSVSRVDQGVGKLMKMLKESGKDDNTIVIYISDNGIAFPGAKTTAYEPGLKLPCIIKDPSVDAHGTVNNAMISWVDLTPTLLDMAGVNYSNEEFHGVSFKDVLMGEEDPREWNTVYASHTFHEITMYYPMRVIREDNYKLIWNAASGLSYPFASDLWASSTWQGIIKRGDKKFGPRTVKGYLHHDEFELYNLDEDPNEVNNLAYKKRYSKVFNRMVKDLKSFQKGTSDPWSILWNNDASLQGSGLDL